MYEGYSFKHSPQCKQLKMKNIGPSVDYTIILRSEIAIITEPFDNEVIWFVIYIF